MKKPIPPQQPRCRLIYESGKPVVKQYRVISNGQYFKIQGMVRYFIFWYRWTDCGSCLFETVDSAETEVMRWLKPWKIVKTFNTGLADTVWSRE